MSSRKEDERNEKVIRGLMKLPPNRRCINCNSLGPQYVCTNFWTFICTACSGIHREFTHRVKSVSMAKFTTAEVEALQKGGNQRARENFLSGWDFQRSRLPDSSNPDRVREFIRNVYVDKKYATGRTSDKPPRDVQSPKNFEEEHRRASSYHSYSQSPPYDYQYEDRRYGKQTGTLSRKPGSDRGLYEGKMSSLVCSPGRLAEQMYEDRFANEITGPRVSDYSVSSASDTFKFDAQSPSFQGDSGYASPRQQAREILIEDRQQRNPNTNPEASARRNAEIIPRPQRTSSSGSVGSHDSNKGSLGSVSRGSSHEIIIEAQQSTMSQLAETPLSSGSQSSVSVQSSTLDLFHSRFVEKQSISSASSIDLFAEINQSSMSSLAGSSLPNSSFAANNGNRELSGSSFVPQPAPSALPLDRFAKINQPSPVSNVEKTSSASATGISLSPSPLPASNRNQDLFGPSLVPQAETSLPSLDLFAEINQPSSISTNSSSVSAAENSSAHSSLPANNGNRDLFHQSLVPQAATSLSSLDLFAEINQPSSLSALKRTSSTPFSEKEGWATFDLPHVGSALGTKSAPFSTAVIPREAMDKKGFDAFPSTNNNPQWSSAQKPAPNPLAANRWDAGEVNISPSTCTQTWNAFDASFLSTSPAPFESSLLLGDGQVAARDISAMVDPCMNLKESNKDELQTSSVHGIASAISPSLSSHVTGPSFNLAIPPGPTSHEVKSRNPFDLPYDSDLEHNNGFFDMGSLQATLPAPFMGSLAQPWYTQNPVPPYVASVASGGLTYAAGQPANTQLPEMPQQGPVASLGGNPFA